MVKCVICELRPANGNGFCGNCDSKLESQRKTKANNQPQNFLTYRGHVVGLYRNGEDKLIARLLKRNPDRLPKKKTINLNVYCDGYSRAMIKRFKACVLKLAQA